MPAFAHSLPDRGQDEWEPLSDHLAEVSERASTFASRWNAADWGRVLGLWHDLGKYSREFQNYLLRANGFEAHLEDERAAGRVDHSTAGAQHAVAAMGPIIGRILAACIAGHHAGLPDDFGSPSSLCDRLKKSVPDFSAAPMQLLQQPPLTPPSLSFDLKSDPRRDRMAFQIALFTRMIFSALVDADFLATEAFMNREQAAQRPASDIALTQLKHRLDEFLAELQSNTQSAIAAGSDVQRCRQEILAACRSQAAEAPGLFSLTVPTGGGKTLSSLAFALEHAERHGLERVIYVIPFTSIIEQTADVFRRVFEPLGTDIVLEHHSDLDPKRETPTSRLACENWDAPLVVTTSVQFFESLFAAKTSRCRKLHRIARSVVILDEAQTLPVEFLAPCLSVLRELAADYGTSIVLCTATQPAIQQRPEFPLGLANVREIISDPPRLYERMKRVDVQSLGPMTDVALVTHLQEHDQFLCIVNTRPHAARLFEALRDSEDKHGCRMGTPARQFDAAHTTKTTGKSAHPTSLFHLSTRLCGAHRARVLKEIRQRLDDGLPCRVISTQLIEAGVDVDFPIVFRALTGLDSIAQAAGRCNREGRHERGRVFVFEPTDVKLIGYLNSIAATGKEVLDAAEVLGLDNVLRYFGLHYFKQSDLWDKHEILKLSPYGKQPATQFREIAERFRLIDEATLPLIVPYRRKGESLIARLRDHPPDRLERHELQRFTVNVRPHELAALGHDVELVHDEYRVLINASVYDEQLGLRLDRAGQHEPESLIV